MHDENPLARKIYAYMLQHEGEYSIAVTEDEFTVFKWFFNKVTGCGTINS
jgi:hypothetical protein